jgi:hypothetical protein
MVFVSMVNVNVFMDIPMRIVQHWSIRNVIVIDVRIMDNMLIIRNRCASAKVTGQERTVRKVISITLMNISNSVSFLTGICSIDCGQYGTCSNDSHDICQCHHGWTGNRCEKKMCSNLCQQCDDHGQCLCSNGFTGRYCQIGLRPIEIIRHSLISLQSNIV